MRKAGYLYWLPAALFAGLIFYMSGKQDPPGISMFDFLPNADKMAHMAEYFILSVLIYTALSRAHALKAATSVLMAVILAAFYGASDEVHQSFVPGRSMDILDWTVDAIGAVLAQMGLLMADN